MQGISGFTITGEYSRGFLGGFMKVNLRLFKNQVLYGCIVNNSVVYIAYQFEAD